MKNSSAFLCQFSPSLLDVSPGNYQSAVMDESGMIRNQLGDTLDQKWSGCKGHRVRSSYKVLIWLDFEVP
jgi:hypothetical protein